MPSPSESLQVPRAITCERSFAKTEQLESQVKKVESGDEHCNEQHPLVKLSGDGVVGGANVVGVCPIVPTRGDAVVELQNTG